MGDSFIARISCTNLPGFMTQFIGLKPKIRDAGSNPCNRFWTKNIGLEPKIGDAGSSRF